MKEAFRTFAHRTSLAVGSPWAFLAAVAALLAWGVSGPLFHFSDTWQLVINTSTTIVTFLMVFLIQNTQNRDATAMHLKLDELLRAVQTARTGLVNLEDLPDAELARLHDQFTRLHEQTYETPAPPDRPAAATSSAPTAPVGAATSSDAALTGAPVAPAAPSPPPVS